jgi:ribosome-binding factor A
MRREEEGAGHRHARLQGLIFEELRALLRDDVADPALSGVLVTAVVLSADYRHARIHFAIRGASAARVREQRGAIERALARATPFLRARLTDAIDIKRVPELRFVFDAAAPDDGTVG